MATKATPSSTIIITGANGSLGSAIVRSITERYPDKFNLILACRNPEDERSVALGEYLKSKGASFSLEKLDLSDLKLVSEFATSVNGRISDGTIPGLQGGGLLNSAAYMTHVKDSKTNDGFDEMYQVIALAPALFIRSLLPSLESKEENAEGALVVSAGSAAHPTGVVDYFQKRKDIAQKFGPEGKVVRTSIVETMNRYGSSKLLLIMLSYAFQRKVYAANPQTKLKFIAMDPGAMSGKNYMEREGRHWVFKILYPTLTFLGPVLRLARKDAINPPEVPAKAFADIFGEKKVIQGEPWKVGKYYILDDEKASSPLSLDEKKQDEVWKVAMEDLKESEAL